MPKSANELEMERLTENMLRVGAINEAGRLQALVQVQAAEAQKKGGRGGAKECSLHSLVSDRCGHLCGNYGGRGGL